MRLLTARTIDAFAEDHADVREQLADWCAMIQAARWRDADHARRSSFFPTRSLPNKRLIFNLKGNEYRIVCSVNYAAADRGLSGVVRVEFIGTHAEYNAIDAATVSYNPKKS